MKSIVFACAVVALLAFVTVSESVKPVKPLERPYAKPVVLPVGAKPSKVVSRLLPKLLEGSGKNISIGGNITFWAEFFAKISVGTPAQTFEVQLDTGSTDLLIYGKGCKTCGRELKFDISKSSTGRQVACQGSQFQCQQCYNNQYCGYTDSYGDGSSVSGFVATDVLNWGGFSGKVSFGAIEQSNVQSFEPTSVDGLMGLAYPSISSWGSPSVLDGIEKANNLYPGFVMCLIPNRASIALGADVSSSSAYQWTAITQQEYYSIYLTDVAVAGQSLGISPSKLNENQVIVDSGTTLLIVTNGVMKAFEKRLQAMCSTVNLPGVCDGGALFQGQCVSMTSSDIANFPPLSFTAKGTSALSISGAQYLLNNLDDNGNPTDQYCLGIQAQDGIPIILGDVFMQNFAIAFDRQKSRVGFAPAAICP